MEWLYELWFQFLEMPHKDKVDALIVGACLGALWWVMSVIHKGVTKELFK
jgi:hypothetical protein